MSLVRGSDTGAERQLERLLSCLRISFARSDRSLPGTPDFAFPRRRKVIFVHGCFWHRHGGCPRTRVPKSRKAFWLRKFEENMKRDRRAYRRLNRLGWSYLVVWECQLGESTRLTARVSKFLKIGGRG
jgi:DNA mismatch endonuclease (patch repair protein)